MTLTKERLEQYAYDDRMCNINDEIREMARMALAVMEAEPVAWHIHIPLTDCVYVEVDAETVGRVRAGCEKHNHAVNITPLYPAPQPLTTSERSELDNYRNAQPDMNYQNLSELYHAQEKRLFKLAQRIKGPAFDKYAHSPSQAIDVLESAAFGENGDVSHAAMLQGKAEPVTTAYKLPPHVYRELVNSLRDTAVKYQGCQQLREQISETLSAVITHTPHCGNSPVIPDGWVACSERMPEAGQYVLCLDNGDKYQNCIPDHDDIYTAAYCDRLGSFTTEYWGDHDWMSKRNPTHWSPLPDMPAAPQQEAE